MIRSLTISIAACLALAPSAYAKHACDSAPYTQVMPKHKGLTFGMSKAAAERVVRKVYRNKARVLAERGNITVRLNSGHQKIFDQVYLRFTNGSLTRMAWSYSNSFQRDMGGASDAYIAILTSVKDKVGGADRNTKDDGVFKFIWQAKQGLSIVSVGKDPNLVFLAFNCDTLEAEEKSKLRSSANMGF